MSYIDHLPPELLEIILKNLKGTEASNCRAVCRRWRDIVDAFTDNTWRHYAHRDYWNSEIAKNISKNISYHTLYKSLSLWDKVEEATLRTTTPVPPDPRYIVVDFRLLRNMMMGVLTKDYESGDTRVIWYFDISTMNYVSYKHYNFKIQKYDENDKIIVLLELLEFQQPVLHIMNKSTDEEKVVTLYKIREFDDLGYMKVGRGRKRITPWADEAVYNIFSNSLIFLNSAKIVCIAKVENKEGTINIEELAVFEHIIVSFGRIGKSVYILNVHDFEEPRFNIYCYEHGTDGFSICDTIDNCPRDIYLKLRQYGFECNYHKIHDTLCIMNDVWINNLANLFAYSYIVITNDELFLKIYKRPFNENGELIAFNQTPNRIIDDLRSCFNKNSRLRQRCKLDVIEIENGHRIVGIAFNSCSLFVIDLMHSPSPGTKVTTMRREACSSNEAGPSAKKSRTD